MRFSRPLFSFLTVVLATLVTVGVGLGQDRKILDHDAYEIWRGIDDESVSDDGKWVLYSLTLQNGDPELVVRSLGDGREHRVPRGDGAAFAPTGRQVALRILPAQEDVRQARLDGKKPAQHPKAELGILDLDSGDLVRIPGVRSFTVPEDGGAVVAYLLEAQPEPDTDEAEPAGPTEPEPAAATATADDDRQDGTELVLRNLESGQEQRYENVTAYALAADGQHLAFLTSTRDASGDGAYVVTTGDGSVLALREGPGHYLSPAFDRSGGQLAFLTDEPTYGSERPTFALLHWDGGNAEVVAGPGASELADGWVVSEHSDPGFSRDGRRLFFGTAPMPAPEADDEKMLDEERVKVDVWHWQDPLLQPMQLLQAEQERERTYLAVAHVASGSVVQLGGLQMPDVELLEGGNAAVAHGRSGLPYRKETSWDSPDYEDQYLVNLETGQRTLLAKAHQGPYEISPDGAWAAWWDDEELAWYGQRVGDEATGPGRPVNLTAVIGRPVHNEDHDWAYRPAPYGLAGWLRSADGDVEAVLYDRYDLWAVDPSGVATPRELTSGLGRDQALQLRWLDLEPDEDWINPVALLLSGLAEENKDSGFWRTQGFATVPPQELVRMPRRFGRPRKAERADVLLFTRESVGEFPDLWVSGSELADMRRVSDANPQQGEYRWATAELISWRSVDGEELDGLVYKPDDFDPSKRYPMMVYFYERSADTLHAHHPPIPHRSVIRPTFYASRGYVVFIPDITYQVGYPGESALKDVVPGVLEMIDRGYIDEANIGVQGHSWGGYQIAYMVTKTDIFKAASAGAIVANMTSAYGGIRWASGMSRMFQYERTQSRLGATLWEAPLRYLENSPLFWADKVETPLLMMHNDHDGAVPWYQGIEMFVALRRLEKPAWLVNYNGEPHWPTTHANKVDWNIRMQQFFDHYLKGEPAPRWLTEGIPAVDKGKTLGLELTRQ